MIQILDHPKSPSFKPQSASLSPQSASPNSSMSGDGGQGTPEDTGFNARQLVRGENVKAKSSLCRNYMQRGSCPYGSKCQFAHGRAELRFNSDQNLYKTRQCNSFIKNGVCMYGDRCNFLHKPEISSQESTKSMMMGYREILVRKYKESQLLMILSKVADKPLIQN